MSESTEFKDIIYLGIAGKIVAIDTTDGTEIWRTKLKVGGSLTNLSVEEDKIIAYSGGQLFGLERKSGKVLWQNGLTGLGYSSCILASDNHSSGAPQARHQAQQAASASIAATTVVTASS